VSSNSVTSPRSEHPEDGELLLDGLEHPHSDVQPRVGAVRQLRRVLHRTEGGPGLGGHVERAGGVPSAR
jgi:hypothetical protein